MSTQWFRKSAMDVNVKEEHQQQQQPPRALTKRINGQKRKYSFLKTVNSLEQLNNIRLKNQCASFTHNQQLPTFKSLIMPCLRKKRAAAGDGEKCAFELMALRPEVESEDIHVYAHSEHNHAHVPAAKGKKVTTFKHSKKLMPMRLMPDADPPTRLSTQDNMEWAFLQTFSDYDQMQTFRCKSQCKSKTTRDKTWQRIRFYCQHRKQPQNCPLMLMALKTTRRRYHVYTHGQHNNHSAIMSKKNQQPADRGHQQQHEMEVKAIKNEQEEERDEEDGEEEDEGETEKDDDKGDEAKGDEMEGDGEQDDDGVDAEEQQQKQPPRKLTKKINGRIKEYKFLKSVKSVEALDSIRFKNYCIMEHRKALPIFKSLTMPCTRKKTYSPGKQCQFELMAVRQNNTGNNTIDVYEHSKHNHPLMSEEKRAIIRSRGAKELMPVENPPKILRTPDNIEWNFLQTFVDYDKMQEFRQQNQCKGSGDKNWWQIRFCCYRRRPQNCEFMLLAKKTTGEGYHVYKYGKHNNHPIIKPKIKQQPTACDHQKQEEMEVDEEEEEEEDDNDEGENEEEDKKDSDEDDEDYEEEDSEHNHPFQTEERRVTYNRNDLMPDEKPPTTLRTSDNIQWSFVRTFADYDHVQKFRCKSKCKPRLDVEKWGRIRFHCRRRQRQNCPFILMVLKTTRHRYHVYKYGQHNDHTASRMPKKKQQPTARVNQKQQKMEVDEEKEEEEDEEDSEGEKQDEEESEHNNPFKTQERRVIPKRNELMPHEMPPATLRTEDNVEWTFFQSFPDYGKMQEFRQHNQCQSCSRDKSWCQIRYSCNRRWVQKCDFMLLAKKTTGEGYHVYKSGEHNHPAIKPTRMEVEEEKEEEWEDDEEEEEDEEEDSEEEEEDEDDTEHNHPFQTEERRVTYNRNDLMPDEKPPTTLRTSDNIQWTFLQSFPDYGKMQKFRQQNQCKCCTGDKKWWQIRFSCNRRWSQKCGFMLLAKKTTSKGYHVYKSGGHGHNHPAFMSKKNQHPGCSHQKQQEMEVDEEKEEDDGEDEEEEEEDNEDSDEEDVYDEYEYHYLSTVKSMEDLDKFRAENHCCFDSGGKPLQINDSIFMPCTKKIGKGCEFELMALRPNERGEIQVYANSEHNHPLMPEVKQTIFTHEKELMPVENPPSILCTPDNIEWTFLQTFAKYGKMQEFRQQNQCKSSGDKKRWRIRFSCNRRWPQNCEFMLLARKTTKKGYHVYKHGEHNHNYHPAQLEEQMEKEKKKEDEDQGGEKIAGEDEPIEKDEEGGGGEEEDNIIWIEDEDAIIQVEQQEEGRKERSMEKIAETPSENEASPREESLEEKLQKANAKVYKWMAGIAPDQIGPTLGDWDNTSLLKMVQMADQEIRQHPEKLGVWRPFLKCAIKKCMSQIEGFGFKYKDLIILMLDNV